MQQTTELKIGQKLRSKTTGEVVEIVDHSEPIIKGHALGLGEEAYFLGVSVKEQNGHYAYLNFNSVDKYWDCIELSAPSITATGKKMWVVIGDSEVQVIQASESDITRVLAENQESVFSVRNFDRCPSGNKGDDTDVKREELMNYCIDEPVRIMNKNGSIFLDAF